LKERHIDQPEPLHPANAEAIAEFAEETGAEVLRGALCYPSESGGWQLGDTDFSEHLAKYRDYGLANTTVFGHRTRNWVLKSASICGTIEV
jgi:hypothetical protein